LKLLILFFFSININIETRYIYGADFKHLDGSWSCPWHDHTARKSSSSPRIPRYQYHPASTDLVNVHKISSKVSALLVLQLLRFLRSFKLSHLAYFMSERRIYASGAFSASGFYSTNHSSSISEIARNFKLHPHTGLPHP
jgi:hypothetical protein